MINFKSTNIKINFFTSDGDRRNKIASIGKDIVFLRNKKRSKVVNAQMADFLAELALLGATLDQDGWIITEELDT
jgi:hypothetical protein